MLSSPFLTNKFFRVSLLLAVLCAIALIATWKTVVRPVFTINYWSIQYSHHALARQAAPSSPPVWHARAAIWLARDALNAGLAQEAETLVAKPAAQGDPFALRVLAAAYAAQGKTDAAIQAWSEARDDKSLAAAGLKASDNGQTDLAVTAYRAAGQLDLENNAFGLAKALWAVDQKTEAVDLLQTALRQYPSSLQRDNWLRQLAVFYRQLSRWEEAAAMLNDLLSQYPQDTYGIIELGWLKYERGDGPAAAEDQFQQAIALNPQSGSGYLAMGQLLSKEGSVLEADAWFALAIQRNPEEKNWWLIRATRARAGGENALAVDLSLQVTQQFPTWAPGYLELGETYAQLGNKDLASTALGKALRLSPTVTAHLRAGKIYRGLKMTQEARQAYHDALSLEPGNATALSALQSLEKQP